MIDYFRDNMEIRFRRGMWHGRTIGGGESDLLFSAPNNAGRSWQTAALHLRGWPQTRGLRYASGSRGHLGKLRGERLHVESVLGILLRNISAVYRSAGVLVSIETATRGGW